MLSLIGEEETEFQVCGRSQEGPAVAAVKVPLVAGGSLFQGRSSARQVQDSFLMISFNGLSGRKGS